MSLKALEHWSNLACAGGVALQDLAPIFEVEEVLSIDGSDALTFRLPYIQTTRRGFGLRDVLRLTDALGGTREYRIRRVEVDPKAGTSRVYGAPVLLDLALSGVVRGPDGSTSIAASLTPAQWIDTYILANLTTDQLTWLGRGVVEYSQYVTLALEGVTRLALLRALAEKLGAELDLRRVGETSYVIDLVAQIGSTAVTSRAIYGRNLISASIEHDDENLATIIQPSGTKPNGNAAPVTLAQMAWRVTNIAGTGPYTLTLADASGGAGPIVFDGQLVGTYMVAPGGTYHQVTESSATLQTITVASYGTTTGGAQVTFAKNTAGDPLTEVLHPTQVGEYGRVVAPLSVPTARGERNLLTDGNFNYAGLTYLTSIAGWRELYPAGATEDVTGTVASNTSSSTSLPVTGFPPGTIIRRGEYLNIGNLLVATTSTTVRPASSTLTSSSSALTAVETVSFALASPLTTAFSAGQAVRVDFAAHPSKPVSALATTVNGAHSVGATSLSLNGITTVRKVFTGDKVVFTRGGAFTAVLQNPITVVNTTASLVARPFTIAVNYEGFRLNYGRNPDPQPTTAIPFTLYDYATGTEYVASINAGQDMSGTVFTCQILVPAFAVISIPAGALLTLTQQATKAVSLTNGTLSWDANGEAAVSFGVDPTLTIDGVTGYAPDYTQGSWKPTHAFTTSGGASIMQVELLGALNTASRSATLRMADQSNVVAAGTTATILGAVNYTAATVTLDGSGAGTLTLGIAVSGISGQGVSTIRHTAPWPTNGGGTNLVRLSSQQRFEVVTIPVPAGGTVPVIGKARLIVWANTGTLSSAYSATLALVNNVGGAVLNSVNVPFTSGATEQIIELAVAHTLAATTSLYLRVTVNALTSYAAMLEWGAIYINTADATIPFTPGSFANPLWQAANLQLAQRAVAPRTIRATVADLCRVLGVAHSDLLLVKGGTMRFEDLGLSSRIVTLNLNHSDPAQSALTFDTLPTRVSALV